ncbi:VOC family protein [Falsiroseomonas bella]|uniref:VOC family protein n=1 Tax=Falsiroseomonas bella TaxID=2184016 RepID=A0A317F7P1_9PROT|nr:VOC family protein [Falsiroseomonas bella]PWS35160.1 VOC family protein [Falsiroseomonas bella]
MQIEPYLFFDGRCEEALSFYKEALGAEVGALMRFRDSPDPTGAPPGNEDKVMHALVRVGGASFMASDGHCAGDTSFKGFGLALTVPDATTFDRVFTALEAGGQIRMPPAQTFFSPRFGMVEDRFGVLWMVIVGQG